MIRWLQARLPDRTKRQKMSEAGYTIVEVMVVLVVSAAVFGAVALSFQGRQGQVEFTQAIRNFEAQLQNMASDVVNGYFPNGLTCHVGAGGGSRPNVDSSPAGEPGGQQECIFLGKLWVSGSEQSEIYTILGKREDGGSDVTSLADANPKQINRADSILNFGHTYDLEIVHVRRNDGSNTNMATFGYLYQLSGGLATDSASSGRTILLYGLPNSAVNSGLNPSGSSLDSLVPVNEGILICLRGSNGRKALIKLGESGSQTSVVSDVNTTQEPCRSA